MDIDRTEEQIFLAQAIGQFLQGEGFQAQNMVNELTQSQLDTLWQQCAEMGWLHSLLPEARGGLGLTTLDAVVLHEEMGRHLLPVPVADALAVTTLLPEALINELSGWLSGKHWLGMVRDTPQGELIEYANLDAHSQALKLSFQDNTLHAELVLVNDAGHGIDPLIGTASITEAQAKDSATSPSKTGTLLEHPLESIIWARYQHLLELLRLAELLGTAAQAMDNATAWAQERTQFSKPIGAFQAIKHRLADDWMRLDSARLSLHEAARRFDDTQMTATEHEFARLAARLLIHEAAQSAAANAIQIHGAMGITWECSAHLFLKRARHMRALLPDHGNDSSTLDGLWVSTPSDAA